MNHLSSRDYADALRALAELEAAVDDAEAFALALALALRRFVLADGAALALMNRLTGQRLMVSLPVAVAVAVVLAPAAAAGDERVLALPLFTDGRSMVSLVLQRRGADFSRRERERLALLRPHLAFLYRQACAAHPPPPVPASSPAEAGAAPLTRREAQVMHWLAFGKTDADIAALMSISRRTVQKHLEHIYVKLGVETRTAAVMRSIAAARLQSAPVAMGEPGRAHHSLQEPA